MRKKEAEIMIATTMGALELAKSLNRTNAKGLIASSE